MKTSAPHIVSAFEDALKRLKSAIVQMAGAAETQLDQALTCLTQRNPELAREIVLSDARLDSFEHEIEAHCMRLLVLRQPVADDLREVIAALKIAGSLERIGDHAANSAKRAAAVGIFPDSAPLAGLPKLGRLVRERLTSVIDAYVDTDSEAALRIWRTDDEVDALYTSIAAEIERSAAATPDQFAAHMHLMMIAKNLERIGDHATNIAEVVYFVSTGQPLLDERPKADRSCDPAEG
ncbi:phosphate signaling complex protein PhoU [Azospirillum doebereinerae]|uniref:Phosphate-specific transport system accessory protein PhoU n=1 Tax=Azospirillum doebereinerae TaxID=92933 RepID=A0A3S0WUI5_9PROT|nr:phosphate signaling complex protein PhoU [Azospirillum doebereinerae]MCG5241784.1 phosphate signaling complex protein PhoU [Azospirillum doebereinerae]RUQ70121.1 phosphate signaling complex protein PhoU [Azospirillum doebereinerae]